MLICICRFAAISISWYFIRGRKSFNGPPVALDEDPTIKGEAPEDSEKVLAPETELDSSEKMS